MLRGILSIVPSNAPQPTIPLLDTSMLVMYEEDVELSDSNESKTYEVAKDAWLL